MQSDYRDRISIAVWAVTMTLMASAVVRLPGRGAGLTVGELSLTLPFAAANAVPILLALLAGTGAEAVVRAHPLALQGGLRLTVRYWALPIALSLIASVLLPQSPSVLYWAAGLLLFAGLLSGVLAALYFSLDPAATGYRRARALLNLTSYGIALLLFLLIPPSWGRLDRSLALGGTALLLALELLRGTGGRLRLAALYALIVGVIVAEVAWVLSLVGLPSLSTGLLLLLLFYLLAGLAWQSLAERLTRRVAVEFAVVGLVGLLLIVLFLS